MCLLLVMALETITKSRLASSAGLLSGVPRITCCRPSLAIPRLTFKLRLSSLASSHRGSRWQVPESLSQLTKAGGPGVVLYTLKGLESTQAPNGFHHRNLFHFSHSCESLLACGVLSCCNLSSRCGEEQHLQSWASRLHLGTW